jgi:glycerol-3-phosphate cytidylyltransferase
MHAGKIGFTCGSFDLLHAGHVLMLEEARSVCDHLVVGLQTDPTKDRKSKNRPVQGLEERDIQLRAIKHVDEIIVYATEAELVELLKTLKPDVRIVGADHKGESFTGSELPIEIYFNTRDHGWSTTDLRNRVYREEYRRRVIEERDELNASFLSENRY